MLRMGPGVDRLTQAMGSFLKEVISKKFLPSEEELNEDDKQRWGTLLANSVATFLLLERLEYANELTKYLLSNS